MKISTRSDGSSGAHGYELCDYQIKDAGELIPVCRDADAIVTQYSDVSAELIDSLEHCAMIIKYGIGVNNIDVEAATRKGFTCAMCRTTGWRRSPTTRWP